MHDIHIRKTISKLSEPPNDVSPSKSSSKVKGGQNIKNIMEDILEISKFNTQYSESGKQNGSTMRETAATSTYLHDNDDNDPISESELVEALSLTNQTNEKYPSKYEPELQRLQNLIEK